MRVCLRHRQRARVTHAHACASGRPWMCIGRSRVRRRGASELFCIDVRALPNAWRPIRCRVGRPWLRSLQCTHVRIRWHPTNGLEQELWLTHLWHDVCATKPARPASTRSSSMRSDATSRPHGDFAPAAGWVEGHLGAARFLCMTCIEWVVEPAAAMTSRI